MELYILELLSKKKKYIYIYILELSIYYDCIYIQNSIFYFMRLNSVKIWGKSLILPFQSQHVILSYYIFKNKHNHTQSILILIYIYIYKSNKIESLFRYY